ncbi:hypothetical protein IM40_10785 (plasmid) [Candidatus Paracaedimonas acanthamoebae]|nr:hypothetical protein IM40_10785 [Candidatus Paracaedimonas acanthamoebae]
MRDVLSYYTNNLDDLKTLINGTHRYNLKGHQVKEITQKQKDFAQDKLDKTPQLIKTKKQRKLQE